MTTALKIPRPKYWPDSRPRKWLIIICGRQPQKDGVIHVEHKDLVEKALQTYLGLMKVDMAATEKVVMVLSGGITKGTTSEATLADRYLKQYAGSLGVLLPEVLLEEQSGGSETNITEAKTKFDKMGYVVTHLYLHARKSQERKVRDMALHAWQLPPDKITFVPGLDNALPAYYRLLDAHVLPALLRFSWFRKAWNTTRFFRFH